MGKFFEGDAFMMYEVFDQLFHHRLPKETWNSTFLFYGHDYGWKNLSWAKNFMKNLVQNVGPNCPNQFTQIASNLTQKYETLIQKRDSEFASTGNLLAEEIHTNLFMLAFLETFTGEKMEFCNRITGNFFDMEQMGRHPGVRAGIV